MLEPNYFESPSYRFVLLIISNTIILSLIAFESGVAFYVASSQSQEATGITPPQNMNIHQVELLQSGKSIHTRRDKLILAATSSNDLKKSSKQKKRSKKSDDPTNSNDKGSSPTNHTTISTPPADPFDGLGRLSRAIAKVKDEVKKREQANVLNRNNFKQPIPISPSQQMYYSSITNKFSKKKSPNQDEASEHDVSSLTKLTRLLDEKLYTIGPRGLMGDYPPLYGVVQNARDNMISLLNYNQVSAESTQKKMTEVETTTYQVVIVFGKHLVRDQITLEYAARVKSLIRMFIDDHSFKPNLICFCGTGGPGNIMSAADAGYLYFRHLVEHHHLDLHGVNFFIDSSTNNDDDVILHISDQVKNVYLPKWIVNTPFLDNDPSDETAGRTIDQGQRRKKVMIHFTLLSTDYHLCNINDVHHRSPRQSLLKTIESIDDDMKKTKVYQRELNSFNSRNTGKLVHTSWSYQYATYPYIYAKDDVIVFLGKCFLLGEELMPLLANMKGVVEQKEFFQRDNYLMLASIRRSLVSLLESLYKNNQLQIGLQMHTQSKYVHNGSDDSEKDFKASLEGALLSLGRCVDVVRPAGLLLGSVSIHDWAKALRALEHSMGELRTLCDPDRPLKPSEWFDNSEEIKETEDKETIV